MRRLLRAHRVERGGARFVITTTDQTAKFDDVPGNYGRICTQAADGWADLRPAYEEDVPPTEHPGTASWTWRMVSANAQAPKSGRSSRSTDVRTT